MCEISKTKQQGAFWYDQKLKLCNGFTSTFIFKIDNNKQNPGNGFAFVIQSSSNSSVGNGYEKGCGYDGIKKSVAIEFDNHQDQSESDPSYSHISLHTQGLNDNSANESHSLAITSSDFKFPENKYVECTIKYIPGTLIISITNNNQTTEVLKVNINLRIGFGFENESAWIGFTAATGSVQARLFT